MLFIGILKMRIIIWHDASIYTARLSLPCSLDLASIAGSGKLLKKQRRW